MELFAGLGLIVSASERTREKKVLIFGTNCQDYTELQYLPMH
jgi:hypothetical protein